MNDHEFWDHRVENEDVLERFRQLDVDVRTESRLARPIERLKELFERVGERPPVDELERLGRELDSARAALEDWDARRVEEGPRAVWLVFESVDLFEPVDKWLGDLIELERRWCRRLHLQARVIAYSKHADRVSRVAMEVEGVGAHAILKMERGIHRYGVSKGADPKVRVRVLTREPSVDGPSVSVTPIRRRNGLFGLALTCRGRIELEDRGLVSDWVGADEETLSELLTTLTRAWRDGPDGTEVTRVYARDGIGARDPRTGAQHPKLKEVLKGDLTPFLEAWRRLPTEAG